MIDLELARQEVASRLPIRVRWVFEGDSLAFDFSRSRAPLCTIAQTDVNDVTDIEPEWTRLYLFGQEDVSDGGGACPYLAVHRDSGEIYGLDIERQESQVFFLNSNVDRFICTIQKIGEILRHTPAVSGMLAKTLQEIDPVASQRSDEWQGFFSYVEAGT